MSVDTAKLRERAHTYCDHLILDAADEIDELRTMRAIEASGTETALTKFEECAVVCRELTDALNAERAAHEATKRELAAARDVTRFEMLCARLQSAESALHYYAGWPTAIADDAKAHFARYPSGGAGRE